VIAAAASILVPTPRALAQRDRGVAQPPDNPNRGVRTDPDAPMI
jgi:hypothetical protein